MKSDSNTEMDLLLRRHARRRGSASPGAAELSGDGKYETSEGPHMDADEMNAYAEGALPEGARARYFAHLADCDQCRAIVTDLTLAANVPVRDEERAPQQATTPQSSWREWLAALFAPPMIRYGAMAAALLCVVGVVFLALRQQQRSSVEQDGPTYVAQNKEGAQQQPASAVKTDSAQPSVANVSPGMVGTANNQAETKDTETAKEARPSADTETDVTASKAKGPTATPVEETKTERQVAAASADAGGTAPVTSAAQPATKPVANEPRNNEVIADRDIPAAPPAPTTAAPGALAGRTQEPTPADRLGQNRKEGTTRDERGAGSVATTNTTTARESEETVRLSRRARTATEARPKPMDKVRPSGEGADTSTASRAGARSTEIRNAGGRQFRREGSAWVDTAYSSGRATVNVRRGSEQYRALIADEPGIGNIADQLGGEVIVVWKSRAYRIR
jgi:hypothetical protein